MDEAERRSTVRRIAREGDPDRALAALFAPPETRDDLFALYAFNAELARIGGQVSEPGLGAIRLQWWRGAVAGWAQGQATGQPVADAFGETMRRRALSPERVERLFEARHFDATGQIMPDWPSLAAYLDAGAANLFALTAEIMGARGEGLAKAQAEAGMAYGLTGLMRSMPLHAAKGRVYLPADALGRHGTSPERLLAGDADSGLRSVLAKFRDTARASLDEAMRHMADLDARSRMAFRPLALVAPYLASLEKRADDPLRQAAEINPLYRLWRLARWR